MTMNFFAGAAQRSTVSVPARRDAAAHARELSSGQLGPAQEGRYALDGHVLHVRLDAQVAVVGEQHDVTTEANRLV